MAKLIGKPPIEITEETCKEAKTLASQGLTQRQIAQSLGIGESTFYEKVKAYPDFLEAIAVGKAKGIAKVTNSLFTKCIDGDVPAIKYYLNNRDNENWKDRIVNEHEHNVKITDLSEDELDRRLQQLENDNEQSRET